MLLENPCTVICDASTIDSICAICESAHYDSDKKEPYTQK